MIHLTGYDLPETVEDVYRLILEKAVDAYAATLDETEETVGGIVNVAKRRVIHERHGRYAGLLLAASLSSKTFKTTHNVESDVHNAYRERYDIPPGAPFYWRDDKARMRSYPLPARLKD